MIDMKLTRKEYSRLARCVVGALVFMGGGTAVGLPMAAAQTVDISTNINNTVYGNSFNTSSPTSYNTSNYANNVLNLKEGASVYAVYGAYSNLNTQQAISNNIVNIYAGSILWVQNRQSHETKSKLFRFHSVTPHFLKCLLSVYYRL